MKKTLLIDGDVLAYQSAFIAQANIQWEGELWTTHSDLALAKNWVIERLEMFKEKTGADAFVIAISDKNNFRRKLNPLYKANRRSKFAPIGLSPMRDWMAEEYGTVIYPNLEADDTIAIMATDLTPDEERIIVSIDKDFKSVPCTFYDFNRDEIHDVSVEDANKYHLMQTMAGDPVDGYKGIPGVGGVKAMRLLDKNGANWDTVLKAYSDAQLTEEEALTNAWMAYLIQHKEFDPVNQQLKYLWMPDDFSNEQKAKYSHIIQQVTGKLDEDLARPKPFDPLGGL
jgi:DNA polymerase-1